MPFGFGTKSYQEHDNLVCAVVQNLVQRRSSDIRAAVREYERPLPILDFDSGKTYIPNVTANLFGGSPVIIEVETDESLTSEHTTEQLKVFSTHAALFKKHMVLIVPAASVSKAQLHVALIGLSNVEVVGI